MGVANLTISNIKPELTILGDKQTFIFNPSEPSTCNFVLKNLTQASGASPSNTNYDFLNSSFKGFRFGHTTNISNSDGLFHLSHLIYNTGTSTFTSTPLFTFNDNNSDTFNFLKPVIFTQGLQTNITPTSGIDIANKSYVDNAIGDISSTVTLSGSITGSGELGTTINTNLNSTQTMSSNSLRFDWSNSGSFAEYSNYHTLEDSDPPPHYVHLVQCGSGNTYRRWLTVYQPGFGSQPTGTYKLGFYHAVNGHQYPFEISTYGSTLRTYIKTLLDMGSNKISNCAEPTISQDAATKNYVDNAVAGSGGDLLVSNDINVNTSGGSNNWIRRSNVTKTGVTIYGLSSSSSSFLIESNSGESAGIGFNGSYDACTIWTAGDQGSYLNIQDEDSSNSRRAYVNTSGAWVQVSSKERKHSIKCKSNNKVLDRFLQLSVKSYGYKYTINKNASEAAVKRVNKKSNKMQIGLVLEELFKIFPNCVPDYYNQLFQDKKSNNDLNLDEEIKDVSNSGIDYNVLLCYFIMAFQEYIGKTNEEIAYLKKKLNNKNQE